MPYKLRCIACNAIFYSTISPEVEREKRCSSCGGKLVDATALKAARGAYCQIRGQKVRVLNGMPICEHYVLTNAMGSRCLSEEYPQGCLIDSLPAYHPRLGVL